MLTGRDVVTRGGREGSKGAFLRDVCWFEAVAEDDLDHAVCVRVQHDVL